MNLTASTTELQRVPAYVSKSDSKNTIWFYVLVALSLFIHAFVAYSQRPFGTVPLIELLFGAFNFAAVVTLFYGISRLYFLKQYLFLSVSSVAAILFAVVMTVKVSMLMITAGWCALLLTPVVCGHLTLQKQSPLKVYSLSLVVLGLFASLQLYPLWVKMIVGAEEALRIMTSDMLQVLHSAGYTQAAANELMDQFSMFYHSFVRLIPSMTLLALMIQFSLGYYLFVKWQNRSGIPGAEIKSFLKWKMPFAVVPILIAAVSMRLSGGELITLVADNLILILALYYSVMGISLMEFFMKKFYVSVIGRILIYLLLFLSHVVGFALLAFLGFVDSFYDWRRKYPLPLDIKIS